MTTQKKTTTSAEARKTSVPHADQARYAALADEMDRGAYLPVADTLTGPLLRIGRPAADQARRGKSPVRTVRLPHELDVQLTAYADNAGSTPSDVMRRAIAEYLTRHPLGA